MQIFFMKKSCNRGVEPPPQMPLTVNVNCAFSENVNILDSAKVMKIHRNSDTDRHSCFTGPEPATNVKIILFLHQLEPRHASS